MKKWMAGFLALVMSTGLLTVPVSAGPPSQIICYDDELLYPVSEAPEMDYTRSIGPVTFSNMGAVTRTWMPRPPRQQSPGAARSISMAMRAKPHLWNQRGALCAPAGSGHADQR